MHERLEHRRIGCAFVLCVLLLVGPVGCGDDESGGAKEPGAEGPAWSEPATGSPDGDGVKSAATVLERLRARVVAGQGHSDASWQRDVEAVAAVLWPPDAEGAERQAARVHMEATHIVGDVSRSLGGSEEERKERSELDPTDVAIYEGFLAAAVGGPEAYKAWCGAEGAKLLLAHKEAQYAKHFPARR